MKNLKAALLRTTPAFRQPPRSTWTLAEHALGSAVVAFLVLVAWIAGMYPHVL